MHLYSKLDGAAVLSGTVSLIVLEAEVVVSGYAARFCVAHAMSTLKEVTLSEVHILDVETQHDKCLIDRPLSLCSPW